MKRCEYYVFCFSREVSVTEKLAVNFQKNDLLKSFLRKFYSLYNIYCSAISTTVSHISRPLAVSVKLFISFLRACQCGPMFNASLAHCVFRRFWSSLNSSKTWYELHSWRSDILCDFVFFVTFLENTFNWQRPFAFTLFKEIKKQVRFKNPVVLDSTTFLNFRVPDSTKSSKIACLCTVMPVVYTYFQSIMPI